MATTLNQMFQESIRKYAFSSALSSRIEDKYKVLSYRELGDKVRFFASGLSALGVKKGDRIALLSENRLEWAIADIGTIHLGAVTVAIFPTVPSSQVQYIVADSGSKIIILSDKKQLAKALAIHKSFPDLQIITMDCESDPYNNVTTFDDVMRRGETSPLNDADYEKRWKNIEPDDCASIVYTSGTTGEPKGAILTHHNFASNIDAAQDVLAFKPEDVILSFVPLNHVMGRMADHYWPLSEGATIVYVENLRRLKQNMIEVNPHYMTLVPRVFEMFQERILGNIAKDSPLKQRLFHWALSVGNRRLKKILNKQAVPLILYPQWLLANKLILSKIRRRLGLQRLKYFITGSAPMPVATTEFFYALGFKILEGYGLTETSPLVAINRPNNIKIGTVGQNVKGVKIKIAEDGEILVHGPNVMKGYYNKPEKTAEAIDADRWFHTGDIGIFDEDGFLRITDRKKDILVLANGKKVAPQPIENRLKESPYISQAVIFGDKKNTVTALIVPAFDRITEWVKERGININFKNQNELAQHAEVNGLIREEINRHSESLAEFEKIHRFSLIDHDLSIEEGEITPTLKIKRNVIMEKYRDLIEAMYR